jgi:hypothetical protein
MARTKEKPQSTSAYFRQLFTENPEWLDGPSNAAVMARWKADHPGKEWAKNVQQGMANIKSKMRKELGRGRRRRRRRKGGAAARAGAAPQAAAARVRSPFNVLERLELVIDEGISLAVAQRNDALDGIIKHLRNARRAVVWEMGQPAGAR